MSGTLYRFSDGALVFGAGACLATRPDFSVLMHVLAQQISLFIIDLDFAVCAKPAIFRLEITPLLVCTHSYYS